jgi:hypothetical protein
MFIVATTIIGLSAAVVTAGESPNREGPGQPTTPSVPPASGTQSSDLSRSGGVITPPAGIDPEIKQTPPATGAKMPIIPPPGTPGGNPAVKPK